MPLTLAEIEKRYVLFVLKKNDGNKAKTAGDLGIAVKTLYNWLNKWGLLERRPVFFGRRPQ